MEIQKAIKISLSIILVALIFISQVDFGYAAKPKTIQTSAPKREMRAAWIPTVQNIAWPSAPGLPVMEQQEEFIHLLDNVKQMGMNAVVVQISPTEDTFYPSKYGPWSQYLTGVQGKDPGYDPLAFMIKEAHKRNLEFHAWFNPYRITMPVGHNATLQDLNTLAQNNPARQHPDWVVPYGKQLYYNPGLPQVRQFLTNRIMEVVKKYDIDAVHFDDYFYPYPIAGQDFSDQSTYEKYGMGQYASKADWRRASVNELVKTVNNAIKRVKPYIKFGISPFGVWRNNNVDPTGPATTAGVQNYDDLYADTRDWIDHGFIDYITPQIYWNIGFAPAAYDVLANWWANEVKGKNMVLYIGQADYKIGGMTYGSPWMNPDEMANQVMLNRSISEIKGSMHYSLADLNRDPLGIKETLGNDVYKTKALIPTMSWLDNTSPQKPKLKSAEVKNANVTLSMQNHPYDKDVAYYVIYRFDGQKKGSINNPANILDTVRKSESINTVYTDRSAINGHTYTYEITACDRTNNESSPGRTITVRVK